MRRTACPGLDDFTLRSLDPLRSHMTMRTTLVGHIPAFSDEESWRSVAAAFIVERT